MSTLPYLPDARLLELWRSVSGPQAALTGPLIRFAGKVQDEARDHDVIDPDLDTTAVTGKVVWAFIKRFCELYPRYREGAKYFVRRTKDVPLVRALLLTFGAERLEKLTVVMLTTDDPFVADTDRGIGILSVKASWLDDRLAAYEAKHGPVQVAS